MQAPAPVSDLIIDRVALLWSRALVAPKFDNGADNAASAMAGVLAAGLADQVTQEADYPRRVEAFRMALAAGMKFDRDHEGEPHPSPRYDGHVRHLHLSTGVDYGPDATLRAAAEIADLPDSVFPWKTTIDFYGRGSISTSYGYGGEHEQHYPLSGGRWLITTLRLEGRDKATIIEAVEAGLLPGLTVEEAGQ